ncbi:MAG: 2-oxoglutarate dehydrogenase E1 component [Gammaproteobacteria bacterium]
MSKSLEERYLSSPLFGGNAPFVEQQYEQYLHDPTSVGDELRSYFDSLGPKTGQEVPRGPIEKALRQLALQSQGLRAAGATDQAALARQAAVMQLIEAYRMRGHLLADLDPLALVRPQMPPELDPGRFGLQAEDLGTSFAVVDVEGRTNMTLGEIVEDLGRIYRGTVSAELAHITSSVERRWLQTRFEALASGSDLDAKEKLGILQELTAAEGIERYLHTRYVGQKRFSLEGGESLIPLLSDLGQHLGANGVEEIVIGMAHRGRINVLVNVMGKSPGELFSEFEGTYDAKIKTGSGDVKYHLGFSSDMRTPGGNVHLVLAFNPSHLEIVNPVVEGSVRARQRFRNDTQGLKVAPVLIHGDAAFAGQGVVMETLQMSQTRGFSTGGTIHIICNNQVGFTTSDPRDARSTLYCSDVAKMIEAPIFHVNGDDPEAVVLVARLAADYRQRFRKDVVIDLVCYRRHGHNEADEPAATQPAMYQAIRSHPTLRRLYAEKLVGEGVLGDDDVRALVETYREGLDEGRVVSPLSLGMIGTPYTVDWTPYAEADWDAPIRSGLPPEQLSELAKAICRVPDAHKMHPRVARIMADRQRMAEGDAPMDWGFAETMAYASILAEGNHIRLTGQDSGRGTFFHRHAVLHSQNGEQPFVPLSHVAEDQASFKVTDSLLSEEAVLGFEYGYATTDPTTLVIWEAQFGDFVNGAQVVIDQFISSGESKWGRICGLTLLLPHGYEGQGPEHSSARLERFLQLCAENNMQVCVPSTPAQIFHLLRRQIRRGFLKPLVVMTPKSLLRHRLAVSNMEELQSEHRFQELVPETEALDPAAVRRVVFCSGKVYYDLLQKRQAEEIADIAIVRIEQLYPFPIDSYAGVVARYAQAKEIVWCQEEPQNQGAWYQIRHRLQEPLGDDHELFYAGRMGAAAPAAGYYKLHQAQQDGLVNAALGLAADASAAHTESSRIRKNA